MIIAIDGPAASGKGTLARRVAAHFGYPCLDTGLLYRAVARDCMANGDRLDDVAAATRAAQALDPTSLDDDGLRSPGVGDKASIVAKIPEVRAALLQFQRDFAHNPPGAVLDGRDIGTVVCPDAPVKIFVTADLDVRARRRHTELAAKGEQLPLERVVEVIRGRDERDTGRVDAPMKPAPDAHILDTTTLSIDAAVAAVLRIVAAAKGRG